VVKVREATEAFAQQRAVTSAAGVTLDCLRLLAAIAAYDGTGIISEIRTPLAP
jgi:hypothetical protein